MKKWIALALVVCAGATAVALDNLGHIDLRDIAAKTGRQAGDIATGIETTLGDLTKDAAEAAPAAPKAGTATLAPAVTTARATRRTFVEEIMVTGSLVAREEILVAPEVDRLRIVTLEADAGDRVEKGDVLATLERETLEVELARNDATLARANAAIAQARSRIAEVEAVLKEAEAQLERAGPLRDRKILSDAVYDQRRAAASTARAQLATARDGVLVAEAEKAELEAQRRDISWRLSKTEIRAPASGLVTARNARIGSLASPGAEPMFKLARAGEIEFEAHVTEPKLARLTIGQKAAVSIAGAGDVEGTIRLISPEIDPQTRLGRVRIFLGADPRLRIGAFGRATIRASESAGISLPLSAVLYEDGKAYVQKVDDGRVRTATVATGLVVDGKVEITSGIGADDTVVEKAGSFLRDGDAVRPVDGPSDPASRSVSEAR